MIATDNIKQAQLQGIKAALNTGGAYAIMRFFDANENLLVTVDVDNVDGVISSNSLTYTPTGDAAVVQSGTMATARLYSDDNKLMLDALSVNTANADVIVNSTAVQAGGRVKIGNLVIRV